MNDKELSSTNSLEKSERILNNPFQETQPHEFLSSQSEAEIELFQAICFTEGQTYPWSSLRRESQSYFAQIEASTASMTSRPESEVTAGAQRFLGHLDRLWDATSTRSANAVEDQFAQKIPTAFLQAIGRQVKLLKDSSLTLADQLVECTYEVMPHWAVEDLQVLARPFAYAMRGTESDNTIEAILDKMELSDWTDLSEIEQIRLCLAYARYTLTHTD